jgi:indolepyruvate decarboxylase
MTSRTPRRSTTHSGNGRAPAAAVDATNGRPSRAAVRRPAAPRGLGAGSGAGAGRPFPARMPMGEFLFAYLRRRGVRHSFGVPGDFALPTFAWLERSEIQSITMTHEPGAGFAADAYSRLNGIGLVCVTYCVGGLNVLNAIAGAYAEKSPVVVVSGAPGRKDREKDPLLHHKVKTFETQRRVYDEVTVASTVLLDEDRAAAEIVRCVEACLRHKRPVYIEVPHDMVDREIPVNLPAELPAPQSDPDTLAAALAETLGLLGPAKKPVILAGVELHRFGLTDLAVKFAERFNIPIAADLLSKSAVAENHPLYLGVYGGAMSSDPVVREYVESADAVLMLGTFITDMNLGIYTAKLDRARTILATSESVKVRYHQYADVEFPDYLNALSGIGAPGSRRRASRAPQLKPKRFKHPNPHVGPKPLANGELTAPLDMAQVMRILALHLNEDCCVVSDVGDAIFGAVGIRTARRAEFIAPAYYLSMGFAVPAGIGVETANPKLRPFVLVGDGAFQMTGTELSTAVRLGLKPIVFVLNNGGYGTMRKIRDGSFNVISEWDYGKVCDLVGGGVATRATTRGELDGAIRSAMGSSVVRVIEVCLPRDTMSPQLANMTAEMARLRGAKKVEAAT